MTKKKFKEITDHVWKYREYLQLIDGFDYPWYGGLKGRAGRCSPEAIDAMQNIWGEFQSGEIKTKRKFVSVYKTEMKRIGEFVSGYHKND